MATGRTRADRRCNIWSAMTPTRITAPITAKFSELSFRVEDVQLTATTPLVVNFKPNELTFEATRFTGPGTNIVLNGTLATGSGGAQNLTVNGDLNMRVLNGISPDFFSSGTAEMAVRINGTFEDPRVIGTASVNNGSVSVLIGNDRWTVANLRAALRFTANQAQIDSLNGTIGGGREVVVVVKQIALRLDRAVGSS